jgi:hypothetical protein
VQDSGRKIDGDVFAVYLIGNGQPAHGLVTSRMVQPGSPASQSNVIGKTPIGRPAHEIECLTSRPLCREGKIVCSRKSEVGTTIRLWPSREETQGQILQDTLQQIKTGKGQAAIYIRAVNSFGKIDSRLHYYVTGVQAFIQVMDGYTGNRAVA